MSKLVDWAVGLLYLFAWRVVRWLPERRVKPEYSESELDSLLHASMRSYMRYWCDTFRFPDWSNERVMNRVEVHGEDLLMNAIAAGTGVIVALPHAGNWDHAGAYFCGKGVKLATVVERLKPELLFRKFVAYREAMGMEVLALDSRSIATLSRRLREGGLVALVADRDLSKTGVPVNFFGDIARMPAGPAVLAINTRAPLLTAFVSYTPTGIRIDFQSVEVGEFGSVQERVAQMVQRCADNFAKGIAAHPQDWHMLQRIWIDADFKERIDA
jgi:lauroyl/myristoyl acyltransferase